MRQRARAAPDWRRQTIDRHAHMDSYGTQVRIQGFFFFPKCADDVRYFPWVSFEGFEGGAAVAPVNDKEAAAEKAVADARVRPRGFEFIV